MNLTISQILTEIITEVGGDTSDASFDDIMLVFLKSGIRKIPAFIKDRLLLVEETKILTTSSQSIDLSTLSNGFIKEENIWYVGSSGQRIPIIRPISRQYFNSIYSISGSGKPSYYVINGKTMMFDKPADVNITIGLNFFKEISNITTSDTFFGDERILEACKSLCKEGYYLDYEEDAAKSDKHANKALNILLELEGDYEDQEQSGHIGQ